MLEKSAIEILVFKPDANIPPDKRGVHENLWLKQRFMQYISVGVYLDGSDLKYYFFEDFYNTGKTYGNLVELKADLPISSENIFESTPKLFMMGHGRGDLYGLGNYPVEIYDENFDKIITDFTAALPQPHSEVIITLEACNTDNIDQVVRAKENETQGKTFLERLSEKYQMITFCGTGPWIPDDPQTGYRASGGFPILHTPITSMGGSIWKHGNSVIFHHGQYQAAVRKSKLASTKTAKALKINTIEYALNALEGSANKEEILTNICMRRDILTIGDLKLSPGAIEDPVMIQLIKNQTQIIAKEKNNYIERVKEILKPERLLTDKDPLVIALCIKDLTVFKDHEDLRDEIFANKNLLQQVMISCGKVLIAGPTNDSIIDLLLEQGIDINSADENGMTALHHAVQSFYNYRKEPLGLINKLLDGGADLRAPNNKGETPWTLANLHTQKGIVRGEGLLSLLKQRLQSSYKIHKSGQSFLTAASISLQEQAASDPVIDSASSGSSSSYKPS